MKPQPAFVRANRAVHLNPEPPVDMNVALVVLLGNAKHDYSLWFDDALENFLAAILGVLLENSGKRIEYFLHRLMKLRLSRVLRLHLGHQLSYVISHVNSLPNARALDVSLREAKIESKKLT